MPQAHRAHAEWTPSRLLGASGKIPSVSTFACFFTRAFDQIRMAAISRADLKLCGSHSGVSIGEDGPSQMGLEDLAMFSAIPAR
jgi:transketolase